MSLTLFPLATKSDLPIGLVISYHNWNLPWACFHDRADLPKVATGSHNTTDDRERPNSVACKTSRYPEAYRHHCRVTKYVRGRCSWTSAHVLASYESASCVFYPAAVDAAVCASNMCCDVQSAACPVRVCSVSRLE